MGGFVSIGECMIELSGGDNDQWRMGFAGDTLNTAWYVRALTENDYPVDYVTAFGDDAFSAKQRAFFAEHAIGTAQSAIIPGARPGMYAITLTGAERSFTYWRNDAAARRLASDPAALAASLHGRDMIYFSGITLAILMPDNRDSFFEILRQSRKAGARVVFDPNYRPQLWADKATAQAMVSEAMRNSDIALPTFPDEQALFGDATPDACAERLAALGVKEIVVKDGTEPALVLVDGVKTLIPSVPAQALDTTGAGDSFNGGYLSARLAGKSPVEAAKLAHRVAAKVVEYRGALAPMDAARTAFSTGLKDA